MKNTLAAPVARWLVVTALAALSVMTMASASAQSSGFEACASHFSGRTPALPGSAAGQQRALCFDEFAILHSGQTKTPLWVAQRLNRSILVQAKAIDRKDRFYEEARLPSAQRARLSDYKGSGFDRGHLAPAADMASENGMAQSFSLANMVPQVSENNRGPWADIEEATRKYVMRARGDVYVVTGVLFAQDRGSVGAGKVQVPSHLYKAVYDSASGKSWVHVLENTETARVGRPASLEDFTQKTGIAPFGVRPTP